MRPNQFKLILADPPYKYKSMRSGRDWKHGAAAKYDVLPVEEIKKFRVQSIAARDSVLFLWFLFLSCLLVLIL